MEDRLRQALKPPLRDFIPDPVRRRHGAVLVSFWVFQTQKVRYRPIDCALWVIKQPPRHRVRRTRLGNPARSKQSLKFAAREREPWLLASSLSLGPSPAAQIVAGYRLRMHIEEGLRDTKSTRYGFGLEQSLTHRPERLAILLLIAALATFMCWLIGLHTIARAEH